MTPDLILATLIVIGFGPLCWAIRVVWKAVWERYEVDDDDAA